MMNSIYVIQDESGEIISASFDEGVARRICLQEWNLIHLHFRSIPIINPPGMEVIVKAPPIPKEFLNVSSGRAL